MPGTDRSYFQERAEQELKAAEAATDSRAVYAHSLLAGFYLDLVHNGRADPLDMETDREAGQQSQIYQQAEAQAALRRRGARG